MCYRPGKGNGSCATQQGTKGHVVCANLPTNLKSPCIVTDRIAHIHRTTPASYAPHLGLTRIASDTPHTVQHATSHPPLLPFSAPQLQPAPAQAKPASTDAPGASHPIHLGPAVCPDVSQSCPAKRDQGIPRSTSRPLRSRNRPGRRAMSHPTPAPASRCSSWHSK